MLPAQPAPTPSGRDSRRRADDLSCFLIQNRDVRIRGNARWWLCGSLVPPSLSGLLCCRASIIVYAQLSCKYFFYKYSKASVCRKPCCVFLPMWRWLLIMCLLVCSAVAIHGLLAVALRKVVQLLAYPSRIFRAVHHWSFSHSSNACHAPSHPSATPTKHPASFAASRYASCPGCHVDWVWSRRFISTMNAGEPGMIMSDAPGDSPMALSLASCWNCPPRRLPSFFGWTAKRPQVSG